MGNDLRTVDVLFTATECIIILALFLLEIASGYRAGIMHHLYFSKRHYLATLYHSDTLIYHVVGIAACIGVTAYCCRTAWRIIGAQPLIRFGILVLSLVICYHIPWFAELNTFAHLLIVLECSLILETFRIIFLFRSHLRPA